MLTAECTFNIGIFFWFSKGYVTNLLEDAKAFSNHAGKKSIDSDDIKMAIKSKVDYSFTTTPPRDVFLKLIIL